MNLAIRRAMPTDEAVLVEFNLAIAWETEHKRLNRDVLTVGVRAVFADAARGFYTVAQNDRGEVVGQMMVTFEWSDWRNGWFWWVQSVYVRADARRSGVFRALYREIERQAAAEPGCHRSAPLLRTRQHPRPEHLPGARHERYQLRDDGGVPAAGAEVRRGVISSRPCGGGTTRRPARPRGDRRRRPRRRSSCPARADVLHRCIEKPGAENLERHLVAVAGRLNGGGVLSGLEPLASRQTPLSSVLPIAASVPESSRMVTCAPSAGVSSSKPASTTIASGSSFTVALRSCARARSGTPTMIAAASTTRRRFGMVSAHRVTSLQDHNTGDDRPRRVHADLGSGVARRRAGADGVPADLEHRPSARGAGAAWAMPHPEDAFTVVIQLGTLVAVFAYFRQDVARIVRGVSVGLRKVQARHHARTAASAG